MMKSNFKKEQKGKWYCGPSAAAAVSCDGLWNSLRGTTEWRERERGERGKVPLSRIFLNLAPCPPPLLSSTHRSALSFSLTPLYPPLLWLLSLPTVSLSLFKTLPSPLHPDFMILLRFLFSLSLCSKVELMNDRACHQFPFPFSLYNCHTHTHTDTHCLLIGKAAAATLCCQSSETTSGFTWFCRLFFP